MKMIILLLGLATALSISAIAADSSSAPSKRAGKLRHIVAIKFKETASKEDIQKAIDAFKDLKNKIPTIVSLEWGTNNSPEHKNKGCTHAFVLTFNSEKDRDAYLVAPAHKNFGKIAGPYFDDVFVFDFWAQD
jgi:hypothetical protein